MQIAKILFLIITGAAMLGGCGDDDNGAVVLNPAYKQPNKSNKNAMSATRQNARGESALFKPE